MWKTIPYAHEGWQAIAFYLLPENDTIFTIKAEDWDYKFDEGEYRYYQDFGGEIFAVLEFELV